MKRIFLVGVLLPVILVVLSQFILPKPFTNGNTMSGGVAGSGGLVRADSLRDGQHDFDFNIGNWKTHIRRRLHPYAGDPKWAELNGTVTVRKVWGGRAQLEEIEAGSASGHFEGMTLFLYNPTSHQWSQSFANSTDADVSNPTIGQYKDGRVELYSQDVVEGRVVMTKSVWSDIHKDSHRYQEFRSSDAGKTWMTVFIADLTRDSAAASGRGATEAITTADATETAKATETGSPSGAMGHDGQHDFDFVFGRWKEHTSRLQHPLTGSTTWIQMDGVCTVSKIWNGRANLTELESDGPNGHLELLALRLYNPQSRQWNTTFATSGVGVLGMPAGTGEFVNGRCEFYDQEVYNDKAIWVRFMVTPLTKDTYRSEQAFSDDGGKTWETNFINDYTRL